MGQGVKGLYNNVYGFHCKGHSCCVCMYVCMRGRERERYSHGMRSDVLDQEVL